ncbi:MAG: xanthine dehydrogenase family protein subunit M [Chloroflexi bacterium]|nr:xanthine dehydrogenase family protein subunit M [Chloroflexota bacterium]
MIPVAFDYEAPATVADALKLLSRLGDRAKVVAGGHSLIPTMKLRLAQPEVLIDISRIAELRGITTDGNHLVVGALATHAQVASSDLVRRQAPLLAEVAGIIGDPQVRNRGTLGGSLAHADPAADYPAAALALDVEVVARGPRSERTIPITRFFRSLLTTALRPNELIVAVRVPKAARGQGGAYVKLANKASHYAVVGVAASVQVTRGRISAIAVGVTGAGSTPRRAGRVERALLGSPPDVAAIERASASAAEGLDLLSDIHGSAEYRAHITRVYTRRAIDAALGRTGVARAA